MHLLRRIRMLAIILSAMSVIGSSTLAQDMSNEADNFYKSTAITMQKVAFKNQYNMKVVGNLFTPKDMNKNAKHAAIIVGHPMGAYSTTSGQ